MQRLEQTKHRQAVVAWHHCH